jgi:hypothetical protein
MTLVRGTSDSVANGRIVNGIASSNTAVMGGLLSVSGRVQKIYC